MSNQTLREKPIPAFSVVNVRPDCEYHVGTEWPFRMYYFVELGSSAISEPSSAESVWGWRFSERVTVVRQVWGRQVTQVACFPGASSNILQLGNMDEAKWKLGCTTPTPGPGRWRGCCGGSSWRLICGHEGWLLPPGFFVTTWTDLFLEFRQDRENGGCGWRGVCGIVLSELEFSSLSHILAVWFWGSPLRLCTSDVAFMNRNSGI